MSNETKWTPGPWVVEDNPTISGRQVASFEKSGDMAGNRCLQVIVNSHFESDAHLIAAAPCLYEALEALLEKCHAEPHGEHERRAAIAALAKARGES